MKARGLIWSRSWWHRLREGAAREMSTVSRRTRLLQAAWGAFVLSGAVWCLARLLLGLRGRERLPAAKHSIEDPDVLAEVESFRFALSIKRQVEVRELSSLIGSTAAAAGWLRPFVLLAARLALLEPPRAPGGAGSRNGPHRACRLRLGNRCPAWTDASFLSSDDSLAGLTTTVATGTCCRCTGRPLAGGRQITCSRFRGWRFDPMKTCSSGRPGRSCGQAVI